MDTHVTFEQAKLLRSKDFKMLTNHFYSQSGKLFPRTVESGNEPVEFEADDFYENFNTILRYEIERTYQTVFSAPEQYQVLEWLRIFHGIWINVSPVFQFNEGREDYLDMKGYQYYITVITNNKYDTDKTKAATTNEETPSKAYEKAIDYVLLNLIYYG